MRRRVQDATLHQETEAIPYPSLVFWQFLPSGRTTENFAILGALSLSL